MIKSRAWKTIAFLMILLALALMAIAFFWPFIQGRVSFVWDTRVFGFVNLHMVTKYLSQGHFLLWNPFNFSGYPYAGDIEAGLFYPVNWLFALFGGAMEFKDLAWYFVFHYFLGALGAYFLCLKLVKNKFAAFVGAIVFAYSGYALGHISHLGQDIMYMWMPWIFLAYIVALERRRCFYTLLAGAVFGLAILVGHYNTSVYVLLGLFGFSLWRFCEKGLKWKERFALALHAFTATVFALAVAAVLVLPVVEFAFQSNRVELTYEQQSEDWSLNPLNLFGLFAPNYNHVLSDNPLEDFDGSVDLTQNYFYIGLLPLFFLLLAFFSKRGYKWYFVSLGALALLAAFGKHTPINWFLFKFFPGFGNARMAVQIMGLCYLAAAVLSSMGAEKFFVWVGEKAKGRILPMILGILVCLLVVGDIFAHSYDKRFYSEEIGPGQVYDLPEDLALVKSLQDGAQGEPFRIADEMNYFEQNKWEYYGVENVWGNGGIKLADYNDLFERLDRLSWQIKDDSMYDALNVRYVLSSRDLDPEHFEKIEDNLYLNKKVLPRVYFENGGELTILDLRPGYLKLKIVYAGVLQSRLIFSEIDYDGWQAYVDGVKVEHLSLGVLRALDLAALELSAGKHVVEFKYEPLSVYLGALISGLSVLLLLVFGILAFKKKDD